MNPQQAFAAIAFPAGVLFGLFCVVGVAYLIYRSTLCLDGKPHEWQVWVPTGRWEIHSELYVRHCLKCNKPQHEWF